MNIDITLTFPIYKSEKYVEKVFNNAISQNFDNMEILIIDNGSTDSSREILEKLVGKYNGNKVIRIERIEENIGLGNARNLAIERSQGKYIFFMDSDDSISPTSISTFYEIAINYNPDIIIGSYRKIDDKGVEIKSYSLSNKYYNDNLQIIKAFFVDNDLPVPIWNKLYKRSFLQKSQIRCNPTHINEDMIFSVDVFLSASTCVTLSEITYNYVIYQGSANKANDKNWSFEYVGQLKEVTDGYKKLFKKKCPNNEIKQIFGIWISKYVAYLSAKSLRSKIITKKNKDILVSRISNVPNIPLKGLGRSIKGLGSNSKIYTALLIYSFMRMPYFIKKIGFSLFNFIR